MGRRGAHTVQLLWEMKYEFPTLLFLSKVGIKFWPCSVFLLLSRSLSKPRALPSLEWSVSELARTVKGRMILWVSAAVPAPESWPQGSHQHQGAGTPVSQELAYRTQRSNFFLIIILFPFGSTYHHYLILQ